MKDLKIIFILIIVQCVLSCNRPHPTACFTVNKSTANIGDTILFYNCSDYDGGSNFTTWQLGEGTVINNNGENIQHIYYVVGQYEVYLLAGGKHFGDTQTKVITIQ